MPQDEQFIVADSMWMNLGKVPVVVAVVVVSSCLVVLVGVVVDELEKGSCFQASLILS